MPTSARDDVGIVPYKAYKRMSLRASAHTGVAISCVKE